MAISYPLWAYIASCCARKEGPRGASQYITSRLLCPEGTSKAARRGASLSSVQGRYICPKGSVQGRGAAQRGPKGLKAKGAQRARKEGPGGASLVSYPPPFVPFGQSAPLWGRETHFIGLKALAVCLKAVTFAPLGQRERSYPTIYAQRAESPFGPLCAPLGRFAPLRAALLPQAGRNI